jgi:hypothetical protein
MLIMGRLIVGKKRRKFAVFTQAGSRVHGKTPFVPGVVRNIVVYFQYN